MRRSLVTACALLCVLLVCEGPVASADTVDLRVRFSDRALLAGGAQEAAMAFSREYACTVSPVLTPALHASLARRRADLAARGGSAPGEDALGALHQWARLTVPVEDLARVVDALSTDWRIGAYEEVLVAEAVGLIPDDPLLRNQAGWLDQVHLPSAWGAVTREGGRGAKVAIVDGGTEWDHPDLAANVSWNEADPEGDGIDQDLNGFVDDAIGWCFARGNGDPAPLEGQSFNARHGTHVAGIVGAVLGNGVGIAGAGGNPELILVNAAHPSIDGGIAYGYEGILYAVARGAEIINCSWRTARFVGGQVLDAPYSEFEALVLKVAREAGALVIAAVGNDTGRGLWTTPAGYEDALAVTATVRDALALWGPANLAPWVDVAAPGHGIISTFPTDQAGLEGPYGLLSGTSMAAALTSGVAALIRAERPEWTVDQLRSRIGWTAQDAGLEGGIRILRADSLLLSRSLPDVVLAVEGLADQDQDGLAEGGEVVDVRFSAQSSFATQAGVVVESWTDDPWLVPLVGKMTLSSVPTGTALDVRRGIKYWVHPSAPTDHVAQVQLRAVVKGVAGPVTSGGVRLRPLSGTIVGDTYLVTASANGLLGQPTPVVSAVEATPAFRRNGDPAGFLTHAALMLANDSGRISDALLPRAPIAAAKDFHPVGEGLVRTTDAAGHEQLQLSYSDRSALQEIGVGVDQRVRLYETGSAAFLLVDYEVSAIDRHVPAMRWGLALDFTVPAELLDGAGGVVDERVLVDEDMRGLRVEAAEPGRGKGVAGLLVLGDPSQLGFSGIAKWAIGDEAGWHIPGQPGKTVSDSVLVERIRPGIDASTVDPTGDRVAIVSGELGDVGPGSSRSFAVAIAIADDPHQLSATLDRARLTWESARIGLTPETMSSGLLAFSANPFRAETRIDYALTREGRVRVDVFDVRGRRVRALVDGVRRAGVHQVDWDGRDGGGAAVASGVYFVRLETEAGTSTRPLTRVR